MYLRRFTRMALCAFALTASLAASAQTYPDRPIRIILQYGAGSTTDVVARIVGQRLQERLGQPVIIDPRPGANGILATEMAIKAPADGYTILWGSSGTHAINPAAYKKLSYDPVKDFMPVAQVGEVGFILTVRNGLPVKNLAELIALAKSKPGEISFGSAASSSGLGGTLLEMTAGVQFNKVNYKTSPQLVTDAIGDRIDLLMDPILILDTHVKNGRVRAIGFTSKNRSSLLTQIPTVAEQGYPEYESIGWLALFAPAGTPKAIVAKLNTEINAVVNSPDIRESLLQKGVEPRTTSPEGLEQLMKTDIIKWEKLYRDAKLERQ